MKNAVKMVESKYLDKPATESFKEELLKALEFGQVICFSDLEFTLKDSEMKFLTPSVLEPKKKNVSYDLNKHQVKGVGLKNLELVEFLTMMKRFGDFSASLIKNFFPHYVPTLCAGKTSFRPIEACGRSQSKRKDDTLLHIDAFPANPVQGQRILRVFSNINHEGKPRVWKVGEPFKDVINKVTCQWKKPLLTSRSFMQLLGLTKGYRSLYDHYMLQIHDAMKFDSAYQAQVPFKELLFSAGSTWVAFTDLVSHAVVSGQYVLEQTYTLEPSAMAFESQSPLKLLEKKLQQKLI